MFSFLFGMTLTSIILWGLVALLATAVVLFVLVKFVLPNRFGQIVIVAILAFWLGGVHKEDVLTSGFDAAVKQERAARDFAIKQAATQARGDADQIDKLEDQLKRNSKENSNARAANYRKSCLDAGSVRRLSGIN